MTLIDPSSNSRSMPTPNTNYHIVDNTTTLNDSALSAVNDQLNRKIEELENLHKQELCELKNLLKDQNQKISDLEKSIKELTEESNNISNKTSNFPLKSSILYELTDPSSQNLIYRIYGFKAWDGISWGRLSTKKETTIEFVSPFPQKFTLDLKGYCYGNRADTMNNFEIYIGKFDEKKYRKEFQLARYTGEIDSVTFSFKTEEEENNTIWIVTPSHSNVNTNLGICLSSLSIFPR
ncbi:MAG: hypothetical protein ON057_001777 [Glomeribacter sp. 1016415]|nr:hypothetical protein [Glomeribacter sp. 1016415]